MFVVIVEKVFKEVDYYCDYVVQWVLCFVGGIEEFWWCMICVLMDVWLYVVELFCDELLIDCFGDVVVCFFMFCVLFDVVIDVVFVEVGFEVLLVVLFFVGGCCGVYVMFFGYIFVEMQVFV